MPPMPVSSRNRRLSAGLRELETLLGVQLVERNRRVVRFTPLGERVVAKAYDVLREADALASLTKDAGQAAGRRAAAGGDPDHRALSAAARAAGDARPPFPN